MIFINRFHSEKGTPIEVAHKDPLPVFDVVSSKSAYKEQLVVQPTPVLQITAQYGLILEMLPVVANGGVAGVTDNMFSASSGVDPSGFAAITSIKQLPYRGGQGLLCRLSALFTDGVVDSLQASGLITSENALTFGFIGDAFGIIITRYGVDEAQELTITVAAGGAETATGDLGGSPYSIALTAGSIAQNCNEMAVGLTAQIPNYLFTANGDTVYAISLLSQVEGAFSFSSTGTAIGAWVQKAVGAGPEFEFIPQASWNRNISPLLDPTKGNVYTIRMQYLGFGNIEFSVEDPTNGQPTLVHVLEYVNANTRPSVSNPTFRIGWLAQNSGNTTDLVVLGGSGAGFIEGVESLDNAPRGLDNIVSSVGLTPTNILTIRNRSHFGNTLNRAVIRPLVLSLGTDSAKGAIFTITANATLETSAEFSYIDLETSLVEFTLDPSTVIGGRVLASFFVSSNGTVPSLGDIELDVVPNGSLTLSARVVATPNALMVGSATWQEDL